MSYRYRAMKILIGAAAMVAATVIPVGHHSTGYDIGGCEIGNSYNPEQDICQPYLPGGPGSRYGEFCPGGYYAPQRDACQVGERAHPPG